MDKEVLNIIHGLCRIIEYNATHIPGGLVTRNVKANLYENFTIHNALTLLEKNGIDAWYTSELRIK